MARRGVRRSGRLAGRGGGSPPPGGAARLGTRGTSGGRPRVGSDGGDDCRARGPGRSVSHARTGVVPADDGALQGRKAGGRAGGLRPCSGDTLGRPGDRPRTGAARSAGAGAHPGPELGRPDAHHAAPRAVGPGTRCAGRPGARARRPADAWADARAGRQPVVVVRGPVGGGEHRLAAAFAAEIAETAGQIRYDGPRGAAAGTGGQAEGPTLLVRGRGATVPAAPSGPALRIDLAGPDERAS